MKKQEILNKLINRVLLLVLLLNLCSCSEEFLEVKPKDGIFSSSIWDSPQNINLALNDLYQNLNWKEFRWADPIENWSDNSIPTFPWVTSMKEIAQRNYSPDNSPGNGGSYVPAGNFGIKGWEGWYSEIRKANILIKNVSESETLTDDDKNFFISQGKFFRAFYYFELAKFFGGVPIIKVPLDRNNDEELFYPRNTYEECIDFIIEDIEDAIHLLPVTWDASNKDRFSKGAALAFKSQVELFASRWGDCVNTCQSIFDLGKYSLVNDYGSLFLPETDENSEVIFSIEMDGVNRFSPHIVYWGPRIDPTTNVAVGWGHMTPTQDLIDAYEFKDGRLGNDSFYADNPYINRDERFYASILYDGAPWRAEGDTIYTRFDPSIKGVNNSFDPNFSHQGTRTGYYLKKFFDPKIEPKESMKDDGGMANDLVYWRFAEILLNYAEAKNELSGPDQSVYDAINQLRNRGGLQPLHGLTKDELRIRIRNERRVELAFEGKRYWDIIRWKIGDEVLNKNMTAMKIVEQDDGTLEYNRVPAFGGFKAFNAPRDYLFPIPQYAVDKNQKLSQNPGW